MSEITIYARFEDSRKRLELLSTDVPEFLQRRLIRDRDYIYTFNALTRVHTLRLFGLYKYTLFSESDKQHALFSLPISSRNEAIDADVLEYEINAFVQQLSSLPYHREEGALYNWLLASAARANNYAEPWARAVAKDPRLCNYMQERNAFERIFEIINNESLDIPNATSNWFSFERAGVIMRIFTPTLDMQTIITKVMNGKVEAACHVTYHFNAPHVFIYSHINAMYSHFIDNLYHDWNQERNLRSGAVIILERICERLIPLNANEEIRKLSALGNVYPYIKGQPTINESTKVKDLLHLADSMRDDELRAPYYLSSLQRQHDIYMPFELFTFFRSINLTIPFKVRSLPSEISADYINDTLTSNMSNKVTWELASSGAIGFSRKMIEGNQISSSHLRVTEVNAISVQLNEMLAMQYDAPTTTLRPSLDEEREMMIAAQNRFMSPASRMMLHFNNVSYLRPKALLSALIRNEITRIKDKKAEREVRYSASEELLLFMGTNREYFVKESEDENEYIIIENGDKLAPSGQLRYNNSTPKLLSIYGIMINRVLAGGPYVTNLMNEGESLVVLGAIDEPMVGILRDYHDRARVRVSITGLGDNANGTFIRDVIPSLSMRNLKATYVLSDIDSIADKFETVEEMIAFVIEILRACYAISSTGAFKINEPSGALILALRDELIKLSRRVATYRVLRVSTQNMFTNEAFFIYYPRSSDFEIDQYLLDHESVVITSYMQSVSGNDVAFVPGVYNKIDADELNGEYSNIIALSVPYARIHETFENMSLYCSTVMTSLNEARTHINVVGKTSYDRMHLVSRSDDHLFDDRLMKRTNIQSFGGTKNNTITISRYSFAPWYVIHRHGTYVAINEYLSDANVYAIIDEVVSIGGRNQTDIKMWPVDVDVRIIDPNAVEGDYTHKNIIIERAFFDWQTIEDDKCYIATFVVMTSPQGAPITSIDQINSIKAMAHAIANANNSYFVFNCYTQRTLNAFGLSSLHDRIKVNMEAGTIAIANYAPVQVLDYEEIVNTVEEEGCVISEITMSVDHLVQAMAMEGMVPDAFKSIYALTAAASVPIFYVRRAS
ncbi:hypothetical protein [Daphnis nerii cypovirus]|uniref:hypothetical protein n=1 Tax=Daphnis nerii cypovirus TaxID=1986950 RepID=UPI000EB72B50|nr:hypothetical protein [Daphnis nerii cypovirus]AYA29389.1 hypothetical protein [Daphnis nerii cypovirus]